MERQESETDRSWWQRPAGGREVLQVALPLVISSLSWTVMTFVDRVFLKWVSGEAMSAAFSASMVWFLLLSLPLGICAYTNTFVAQYLGDGQLRRIGPSVWQGVWAGLAFTPLALGGIVAAPWIFRLGGHPEAIAALEVRYFEILCVGVPGMLISQALAAFFSGRGKTRVVMWVDAVFAIVNLVLDYLMIFGHGGFPEMGIAGAGWATVWALWMKAIAYAWLMLSPEYRERFGTWVGLGVDVSLFRRLMYYGGPSGIQMALDVAGFTVFIILIGRLGEVAAEATSMAFSISTLAFMPIYGLAMATSILVGQRLGENRDDLAARSTWTTLSLGLGYMAIISFCYLVIPELFLFPFFAGSDQPAEAREQVWLLARHLLRFVAAYNLFDAVLMVFAHAIKGAGDTQFVLRVSLVMSVVLAGLSWLCVETFAWGVYGCWCVITGWVWILGTIFFARFQGGNWRSMRVIEQEETASPAIADKVHWTDAEQIVV